jgi:membrane protease subunit HflC
VGVLLLVLLLLFSTTFTVKYNEVAIKRTFGRPGAGGVVTEPGLHYRLPVFIDRVTKLDTRLQLVESPLEEISTQDGLQVVVRAFLLWKVDTGTPAAPLAFFQNFQTVEDANQILQGQFRTAFTGALSKYRFAELIGDSSRLDAAESDVLAELSSTLMAKGVRPVTVGVSQIVLPPKVSSAVLSRMQATRNVLAEGERNTGMAEAERIRSDGNTKADKIRAFAGQRAAEIRALGEREAAKYLEQMNEDPDLAMFLAWLDALERTLSRNTTVILPADGLTPFHMLGLENVVIRNGIPFPAPPPAPAAGAAGGDGAGEGAPTAPAAPTAASGAASGEEGS